MPYRLDSRESAENGLRRCAREQLDSAIDELTAGVRKDPVEAVHSARKDLKKERSLLRLFRGTLDPAERRRENDAVRHAAQLLSTARDAEVMVQALDDLSERFAGQVPKRTFTTIRKQLTAERDPARASLLDSGLTDDVADELKAVRARIDDWRLGRGGWRAIESGLDRSYRRGRSGLERAAAEPSVENFHEWRKRTKDLWYHLRVLTPISPGIVGGQAKDAHRLADLLGDDHDLAVLRKRLEQTADAITADLDPAFGLIDHRREQLQQEAVLLGRRLYAEKPSAFSRRLHRYWKAWRRGARAAGAPRPTAAALG
ncbi:MAG TPA: CHAD domain-containing protein [Solirubrobacteraceae bacterium]|nr:CHAD domain-containing protein [Solirubrobacteraceae bacterium]